MTESKSAALPNCVSSLLPGEDLCGGADALPESLVKGDGRKLPSMRPVLPIELPIRAKRRVDQEQPFIMSYASSSAARLRRIHDPLADQIAQRLGGTAAERAIARAAIETRYRVFVGEAEAAVQLDRL